MKHGVNLHSLTHKLKETDNWGTRISFCGRRYTLVFPPEGMTTWPGLVSCNTCLNIEEMLYEIKHFGRVEF